MTLCKDKLGSLERDETDVGAATGTGPVRLSREGNSRRQRDATCAAPVRFRQKQGLIARDRLTSACLLAGGLEWSVGTLAPATYRLNNLFHYMTAV